MIAELARPGGVGTGRVELVRVRHVGENVGQRPALEIQAPDALLFYTLLLLRVDDAGVGRELRTYRFDGTGAEVRDLVDALTHDR